MPQKLNRAGVAHIGELQPGNSAGRELKQGVLMSRASTAIAILAVLLTSASSIAMSTTPSPADEIRGVWKGTSTCVNKVKFPACYDEVVIYTVAVVKDSTTQVELTADKIVNGERQTMGVMTFTYHAKEHSWLSELDNGRVHALWSFVIHGKSITGTLVDVPSKDLIRNISVARE